MNCSSLYDQNCVSHPDKEKVVLILILTTRLIPLNGIFRQPLCGKSVATYNEWASDQVQQKILKLEAQWLQQFQKKVTRGFKWMLGTNILAHSWPKDKKTLLNSNIGSTKFQSSQSTIIFKKKMNHSKRYIYLRWKMSLKLNDRLVNVATLCGFMAIYMASTGKNIGFSLRWRRKGRRYFKPNIVCCATVHQFSIVRCLQEQNSCMTRTTPQKIKIRTPQVNSDVLDLLFCYGKVEKQFKW